MNAVLLRRRSLLGLPLSALPAWALPPQDHAPSLMLANVYRPGIALADYWVSEKYDGVRGFWDGGRLFTRGGNPIATPAWFTAGWPAQAMDGELWAGHGAFAHAVSAVRHQRPTDAPWHAMRYMVFDLPTHGGLFDQRLSALRALLASADPAHLRAVPSVRMHDHPSLQWRLREVLQAGGEGLMLHRGASSYRHERSDDLLKFKPFLDAEARVLAWVPGRGKNAGRLGALWVETPQGRRFKLGTGFSDAERRDPPARGSWVVYRFRDVNPSGIPRFASFLRMRADAEL